MENVETGASTVTLTGLASALAKASVFASVFASGARVVLPMSVSDRPMAKLSTAGAGASASSIVIDELSAAMAPDGAASVKVTVGAACLWLATGSGAAGLAVMPASLVFCWGAGTISGAAG